MEAIGYLIAIFVVTFLVFLAISAVVKGARAKPCPACRKNIDPRATVCPYCQTPVTV